MNHGLRTFIDEEKRDFKFDKVHLLLENEMAVLTLSAGWESLVITYFKGDKKTCLVSKEGRDRPARTSYLKACCIDLNMLLMNQKSIFKSFTVLFRCNVFEDRIETKRGEKLLEKITKRFLTDIANVLQSRDVPIKTQQLDMHVMNQDQLMAVLPYLCPETLTNLYLKRSQQRSQDLELDEVLKTQQFKRLTTFKGSGFRTTISVDNFSNLVFSDISLETVKVDDLLYLKEVSNYLFLEIKA